MKPRASCLPAVSTRDPIFPCGCRRQSRSKQRANAPCNPSKEVTKMALTGIMRPGFIQIRVLDMPASIDFYTMRIGLHQVAEGPDGRVYLKTADEFDHHSIVLRRADQAGVDVAAFKCLKDSDLDHYEKRVKEYGIPVDHVKAGEQPGIGRRIGFTAPSGHRIELYAQADQSDPKPYVHNPHVWSVEPHGMAARRLDHALL